MQNAAASQGKRNRQAIEGGNAIRMLRILPAVAVVLTVALGAMLYWKDITNRTSSDIQIVLCFFLSGALALLPALICIVQNITKRRQLDRLASLEEFPVSQTTYFKVATLTVDTDKAGGVGSDFVLPLLVYVLIIFVGSLTVFIGFEFTWLFSNPSVLLGGLKAAPYPVSQDVVDFQRETFVVISIAFLSSYVYSLGRLLDRVNNNDLYPLSLYYYAVRIVLACVVAAVVRDTMGLIASDDNALLILLGFGIGIAPDLFILALLRRAFQALKVWGVRDDPDSASRPKSLALLMIDDLSRDKIDRLKELGVDSAQTLARQNPFLLLPRLPFDLGLLVDWIAQAQLYALVKDQKFGVLRDKCVRDIQDFYLRLKDPTARAAIAAILEIADGDALVILQQLEQDPSFMRLREVRLALLDLSPSDCARKAA